MNFELKFTPEAEETYMHWFYSFAKDGVNAL
jgi:hypothetical protein